jgi:hypothetical protein
LMKLATFRTTNTKLSVKNKSQVVQQSADHCLFQASCFAYYTTKSDFTKFAA